MNRTYSFWHLVVAFLFLIVLIISYCNKSFGQNKPAKGIGKTFLTDTTKPPQLIIPHKYILRGSDTMFILLQNLMISPDDVTPRQKNIVMDWFRQNVKVDSMKLK